MASRSLRVVNMATPLKKVIQASPGFKKKRLADDHLDLVGLCEFGCAYCSSNSGWNLRTRREELADVTEAQLGERLYPATAPDLTFRWTDVVQKLEAQLAGKPKGFGKGRVLIVSQLTDPLSPALLSTGFPEAVLRLLLDRTSYTIRLLTKSAAILTPRILRLILEHRDRFLVGLSLGTLDEGWARRVEKNTSPPSARLFAISKLQAEGVRVYGMLCPVFPHALPDVVSLLRAMHAEKFIELWWEPFNDRTCWELVAEAAGEPEAGWLRAAFGPGPHRERGRLLWSAYARDLFTEVLAEAEREGYADRLRYLLYEDDLVAEHAAQIAERAPWSAVLLQGKKGDDDLTLREPLKAYDARARAEWAKRDAPQTSMVPS